MLREARGAHLGHRRAAVIGGVGLQQRGGHAELRCGSGVGAMVLRPRFFLLWWWYDVLDLRDGSIELRKRR
jgi:hypothetical protein